MIRLFVWMVATAVILPAAAAGIVWEIAVSQFKFGRKIAARTIDKMAGF